MPLPGRQCMTTVSPGLQETTPGPVSTTVASAACPNRCGRNLSAPLTASISLICAPQIPDVCTWTSTWPCSRVSGRLISSTISGLPDSTRIAAFAVLISMRPARSLEIDEFVVAGVAELFVQPDPFRGMQDGLRRQRPAFEVVQLGDVPVGLDHHILVLADPLDLLQRRVELV